MTFVRQALLAAFIGGAALTTTGCATSTPSAATTENIDAMSVSALDSLTSNNAAARAVAAQSRAVLIFPSIVKAGFVFGGAYGEGQLRRGNNVVGYYNSFTGSWGLQAGAQSYGYAVFLMNEAAENYVTTSDGWEIGVGPTVVVVDQGVAENISTSTLQDDAYAFIFDQRGLMAGVSIEGTKVTKVK
jgi:lipid-binding SYLF domain-containing protein